MLFLNNLDLHKNEIQNFRVQNLATAPENPVAGQHYFNTVDKTEYVFDGTNWVDALSQGNYTFTNGISEENRTVTLTAATDSAIGGVIVGTNIDVTNGTISVKDATNAQKGLIQLATDAEAAVGTDTEKAINAKQLAKAVENDIELTDLSIADGSTNYLEYDNTKGEFGAKVSTTPAKDDTNLITSGAVFDNEVSAVELKADSTDTIQVTKAGNTTNIKISKVDEAKAADKATADEDGNNIKSTYATKDEVKDDITLTDLSATGPILYDNTTGVISGDFDSAPTADSNKLLKSGAIYTALNNLGDGAVTDVTLKADTTDTLTVAKGDGTSADIKISKVDEAASLTDVTATAAELNILDGATLTTAELNILDGVTAEAAEINILDGATVTTEELNQLHESNVTKADLTKLHDVTATAAEINKLAGNEVTADDLTKLHAVTATADELNILDGVTADKDEINILDGAAITTTELNALEGVTDNVQDQLDAKIASSEKGAANGVATLDNNGLVPAAQLPAYVDDVIDILDTLAAAPATCAKGDKYYNTTDKKIYVATAENTWDEGSTPEADKIYVNVANNMSYRWSGTTLVQIGADKLKGFNGSIVGDGTTTTFTINHNLGTRNVVFEIYDEATFEKVYVQVIHTSTTAVQVIFSQAPAVGDNYHITVIAIA